jgi:hypothetical protein
LLTSACFPESGPFIALLLSLLACLATMRETGSRGWKTIHSVLTHPHNDDWQRLSMSQGTKGPRWFDWAVMPILHRWEDDGRHFLLIRCKRQEDSGSSSKKVSLLA